METEERLYEERITSSRTQALFVVLTVGCFLLLFWAGFAGESRGVLVFVFCCFCFFLFYTFNYRMLEIGITASELRLKFGIFTWTVELENIQRCTLDDAPWILRFGGVGIHFYIYRLRYRASLNFLEHPRVAVALKRRAGLVQEISFSTRQPEEVLRCLRAAISGIGNSQDARFGSG